MTNEEKARLKGRLDVIRKRMGDLTVPAADTRDAYVMGLLIEALDAAEGDLVPTRRTRKGKADAAEDATEQARRGA